MAAVLQSSTLNHPVSSVIRQYMIDVGLSVSHFDYDSLLSLEGTGSNWGTFTVNLPSTPDNVIVILDQEGDTFPQLQASGMKLVYSGIQILVRCHNYVAGYRKANQIYTNFTEGFDPLTITIGESELDFTDYALTGIKASSPVLPLGRERDADSENYLFSTNFLVCLSQYDRTKQGQEFQQEE